jgi:hypothetical protein
MGKNRSGSQDRQAAADRQCIAVSMLFLLSGISSTRHEVMVAVRPATGIVSADDFSRPGVSMGAVSGRDL